MVNPAVKLHPLLIIQIINNSQFFEGFCFLGLDLLHSNGASGRFPVAITPVFAVSCLAYIVQFFVADFPGAIYIGRLNQGVVEVFMVSVLQDNGE